MLGLFIWGHGTTVTICAGSRDELGQRRGPTAHLRCCNGPIRLRGRHCDAAVTAL